jgi:elongation factor G
MKEYPTESIRNIALASHSSSGKTKLAEAFLHFTGATTRLGKIEDGTTVSDAGFLCPRPSYPSSTGIIRSIY